VTDKSIAFHGVDDHRRAISSLIAVVGAPRSGTTLVTASLSVHSQVATLYEPWNANQARIDVSSSLTFNDFLAAFAARTAPRPVLLVKETATDLRYLNHVDGLLTGVPPPIGSHLVITLRNPFHIFLSEVQARREWWGEQELEVDQETFSRWATRMLESCRLLAAMARRHDAILLSYEAFCRNPAILQRLTGMVGLAFEQPQGEFEKHVNRAIVRGDNRVAKEPQAISSQSTDSRRTEFQTFVRQLSLAPSYPVIARLQKMISALPPLAIASAHLDALEAMSSP
jgi:hypothetical protein